MSWASRKRTVYAIGVLLFLAFIIGVPAMIILYEPPTCFDGKLNQGETAIDKGGPCILLDERLITPYAVLWSRAFPVRESGTGEGSYNVAAYVENPNSNAGARTVNYLFKLYDESNVLVAERGGTTFVMPGGITPVFEGGIRTGNRVVARTYFEFLTEPVWERLADASSALSIGNKEIVDVDSTPRLSARVQNTSVNPVLDPSFVAVIFDTAGNAFAASATRLPRIDAGEEGEVVFAWFRPFSRAIGRIDVLPLLPPQEER